MQPFPRSGAATSSSDPTTPTSSDTTTPQTSSLVVEVTSGPVSSTTPTTSSTEPTTSSTPTETTTSTPSSTPTPTPTPTSTSPTSSAVPPTTSDTTPTSTPTSQTTEASTSASSTNPLTNSSTFSSSIPSLPTTTSPPTSSSSIQGTPTTITSSYTTYVDGSQILTATAIPSTIPADINTSSSSNRTAIVAGSAAGGTALLLLLLTLAFCTRRKRFKRLAFFNAITLRRKQARSRATLLDGEDTDVGLSPAPLTPEPSYEYGVVGRRRVTESGSAFREDVDVDVPHEGTRLMHMDGDDHHLELGQIVDDVMGPPPTAAHYSDRSVSSMYRASVADSQGGTTRTHSRSVSNSSNAALLEAAGLAGSVPVRSSPLAQPETTPREDPLT